MKHYGEAYEVSGINGDWKFKIYHYDDSGEREVVVYRSFVEFESKEIAIDAAGIWADEHPELDVELIF